jgi:hypothetical protein
VLRIVSVARLLQNALFPACPAMTGNPTPRDDDLSVGEYFAAVPPHLPVSHGYFPAVDRRQGDDNGPWEDRKWPRQRVGSVRVSSTQQ